ncbi:hypothetical protein SS37A_17640 [Methylocystis iwaonis]|uniref:Uncharacterized protein n=1 Tax=Methylocystis iwaonis TaxID=2885079 RepID=A0ABM8E8E4_9HYPH|nr:hypothetical protein SS37A_17640 [Methylocystis iwaonis]
MTPRRQLMAATAVREATIISRPTAGPTAADGIEDGGHRVAPKFYCNTPSARLRVVLRNALGVILIAGVVRAALAIGAALQ